MNYREWLQDTIEKKLKAKNEKLNLAVCDYSNARYDGGVYDCTIVVNGLGGTTNADIEVIPIQLMCWSGGQIEIDEEGNTPYDIFYEVLKEFCKENNLQTNVLNNFEYYKHSYVQPFPINPLESDSATFRFNFVVSGSLTITRNVVDIKKVYANGQSLDFLNATLNYFTNLSASNKMNSNIATNVVQLAGYSLQLQMYNRNNVISAIAKDIRQNITTPNEAIDITLEYIDGTTEDLGKMIIESLNHPNDRINPSMVTIQLAKYI